MGIRIKRGREIDVQSDGKIKKQREERGGGKGTPRAPQSPRCTQ